LQHNVTFLSEWDTQKLRMETNQMCVCCQSQDRPKWHHMVKKLQHFN